MTQSSFVDSLYVKTNDQMLVVYLAALVRSIVALHNLINNKLTNRDAEKKETDGKKDTKKEEKKEEEKKGEEKAKAKNQWLEHCSIARLKLLKLRTIIDSVCNKQVCSQFVQNYIPFINNDDSLNMYYKRHIVISELFRHNSISFQDIRHKEK